MMEEKKEIYRGKAVAVKDEKQTIKALFKALIFCAIIFALERFLPFAWVFEIGAIVASSIYIYKVMKQGTFIATYVLYEDTLVVLTRYGLIEMETARYNLSEAVITEKTISQDGITKPFYPDEKLKKLLLK